MRHRHTLDKMLGKGLKFLEWDWLVTHAEFHHDGNKWREDRDHINVTQQLLHLHSLVREDVSEAECGVSR